MFFVLVRSPPPFQLESDDQCSPNPVEARSGSNAGSRQMFDLNGSEVGMMSVGVSRVDILDRMELLLISFSISFRRSAGRPPLDEVDGSGGESGGDEKEGETASHTCDGGGGNHDAAGGRKLRGSHVEHHRRRNAEEGTF